MGVQYFDESTKDLEDADIWFHGEGWYFADEIQFLNGPFDTEDQAKEAMDAYGREFLGTEL